MKPSKPEIIDGSDHVNQSGFRDILVERYLILLERCKLKIGAQTIANCYLEKAWRAYARFCASGDCFFRYSAWAGIQAASDWLVYLAGRTTL